MQPPALASLDIECDVNVTAALRLEKRVGHDGQNRAVSPGHHSIYQINESLFMMFSFVFWLPTSIDKSCRKDVFFGAFQSISISHLWSG